MIAEVAVFGYTIKPSTYSYHIPDQMEVSAGSLVEVPFGKESRRGVVVGLARRSSLAQVLKDITATSSQPLVTAQQLALAKWLASHYFIALAEALPGFEATIWYGLLAPANTPEPVINRLYSATLRILSTPAIRERLASLGMVVAPMPPAEFDAFIATEITRWTADAKAAGIEAK